MLNSLRIFRIVRVYNLEILYSNKNKLPKSIKSIGCKLVFKTKQDSKSNVERYKVRIVAKGFTQKFQSIDQD